MSSSSCTDLILKSTGLVHLCGKMKHIFLVDSDETKNALVLKIIFLKVKDSFKIAVLECDTVVELEIRLGIHITWSSSITSLWDMNTGKNFHCYFKIKINQH